MITRFIDKIACGISYDPTQVVGYSEEELAKIERLYDIKVCGDFREFMLEMGRSDGGLIGDDPIVLYRPAWDVRGQILYQVNLFTALQESGNFDYVKGKPFSFSCEGETQYFFLRTDSEIPDRVYHYDENEETASDTGLSFIEYMKRVGDYYNQPSWDVEYQGKTITMPNKRLDIVCRGELLII